MHNRQARGFRRDVTGSRGGYGPLGVGLSSNYAKNTFVSTDQSVQRRRGNQWMERGPIIRVKVLPFQWCHYAIPLRQTQDRSIFSLPPVKSMTSGVGLRVKHHGLRILQQEVRNELHAALWEEWATPNAHKWLVRYYKSLYSPSSILAISY